jgi:hypothetical protein
MGIGVNNDSRNVTIEYNNIYGNGVWGNDNGINVRTSPDSYPQYAPTNLTIRYNLIHDNIRTGISFMNAASRTATAKVYSNIIFNNGVDMTTYYNSSSHTCADIDIASGDWANSVLTFNNNTIYNSNSTCSNFSNVFQMARDSGTMQGTPTFNLFNNIIYSGTSSTSSSNFLPLYADYGSGTFNHGNNLIYRSTGATYAHVSTGNYSSPTVYDRNGGASDIVLHWESTAKDSLPAFTGGTLPTGFAGTYGIDMVPNTPYFSISSGDAINNGANLGTPFNGCINGAALASIVTRPQFGAYDIGAYEYSNPPPAPAGLRIQ